MALNRQKSTKTEIAYVSIMHWDACTVHIHMVLLSQTKTKIQINRQSAGHCNYSAFPSRFFFLCSFDLRICCFCPGQLSSIWKILDHQNLVTNQFYASFTQPNHPRCSAKSSLSRQANEIKQVFPRNKDVWEIIAVDLVQWVARSNHNDCFLCFTQ